jgi:hypothetical protein
MKGRIRIKLEVEAESDLPEDQQSFQRVIDNANERIEAAVAQAVIREIKLLLPDFTKCDVILDEGDEPDQS